MSKHKPLNVLEKEVIRKVAFSAQDDRLYRAVLDLDDAAKEIKYLKSQLEAASKEMTRIDDARDALRNQIIAKNDLISRLADMLRPFVYEGWGGANFWDGDTLREAGIDNPLSIYLRDMYLEFSL